jgi:hypothetical protein
MHTYENCKMDIINSIKHSWIANWIISNFIKPFQAIKLIL